MAQKSAARGRPKGTGVDDAGHLAAIAKTMAANPGMKPTTAIKALGITNPSVVRRLRDKYHQQHRPRQAARAAPTAPARANSRRPASNVIALRAHGAAVLREHPEPLAPHAAEPAAAIAPTERRPLADDKPANSPALPRPDLFGAACAASVAAAKTVIHLQYKALWYAFQFSPYACAVRNYEFTRLVLNSLVETAPDPRSSRPTD